MELNAFLAALKSSLVERGIDQNTADRYATSVSHSFQENDLKRIATYQKPTDFSSLSDNLAATIKRKTAAAEKARTAAPQMQKEHARPQNASTGQTGKSQPSTRSAAEHNAVHIEEPTSLVQRVTDFFKSLTNRKSAANKTPRSKEEHGSEILEVGENGKLIFWVAVVCLSPLWLFLALVYFGFFAALYVAVTLAIVGCVLLLVAIVTAGSAVALVGLVYGALRLFSIPAEGLYEIGLAVIIIGLVLLFGVLIYNFALRVLPLLYAQIKRLFLFLTDKLKILIYQLKKECYKL